MITIKTGELKLEPVRYWIELVKTPRWWWFPRMEYFVCCEFSRLGPFDTWNEAAECRAALTAGQCEPK